MVVITIITLIVLLWAPRQGVVASAPPPPHRLAKVPARHGDAQGERLDAVGDDVDDALG
jgi:hypothetical protein